MAAAAEAAEGGRPLGALLGAIAQAAYHGQPLAEEPLRGQLYPEAAPEEFRALRAKMGGLLQVPEHVLFLDRIIQISRKSHEGGIKSIFLQTLTGDLNRSLVSMQSIASADMDLNQLEAFLTAQTKKQGGITSDQAAVIADFWKKHRAKIRESLISQSQWDNVLKNMNWRVDLKSQSRHIDQINTPVAIVEMELGKNGQESEFLCLEFDEAKVNQMLKKLSEIEASMSSLTQAS